MELFIAILCVLILSVFCIGTTYSAVEFHRAPFCPPYFAAYAMETWKTNCSVGYSRMGRDALFFTGYSVIVMHNI